MRVFLGIRILMGMSNLRVFLSGSGRLVMAMVAILSPSVAWAQSAPTPALRDTLPAWLGLLVIFFIMVIIIMVSLMSSKRGHQD